MRIGRILLLLLTAFAIGAWLVTFRPTFLGGPATYVMVSGTSMEPTLDSGDLVLVRQQGNYSNGDIVAFRVPEGEPGEGGIVIHRIVGGTAEEGYIVQGDNKNGPDPWQPTAEDIVGRLWFSVPGGGRFVLFLRQPLILGAVAGLLSMLFVLTVGESGARGGHHKTPWRFPLPTSRPWNLLVLGLLVILALSFALAAISFHRPIDKSISLYGLDLPGTLVRSVSVVGIALAGGAIAIAGISALVAAPLLKTDKLRGPKS